MASELRVTTIANNAGSESVDITYVVNGSAKAWSKHSMNTNTIADSLNISSMTDQATGKATLSITNSMNTATDYVAASGSSSNGTGVANGYAGNCYPQNSSSYWVIGYWSTTLYDLSHMGATVTGDLA